MQETEVRVKKNRSAIIWIDILLLLVLVAGAYFRLVGIDWGEYQYLHPDERFLVWVGSDISPVKCLDPAYSNYDCPDDQKGWMGFSEYFDTVNSTMNPNNRGHGFYVYGTLPMFLTRYAVEWVYGHSGFNEMTNIGRVLSALADLLTVSMAFAIASRLYDRRVGLLAAAFSAAAVMMIQQSHYFSMEPFLNLFIYLAIYFAVRIAGLEWQPDLPEVVEAVGNPGEPALAYSSPASEAALSGPESLVASSQGAHRASAWSWALFFLRSPMFLLSLGFGVALGCAVASKLNAAPVALLLPAAFALQWLRLPASQRWSRLVEIAGYLALAAMVSLVAFRLFQPYAFSGPGVLGITPNQQWVDNIREQRNQAGGDVDFPPAMQWARRPLWFSGQNLVLWGLGLPLGTLAWAGFLWAGWRMLADRSRERIELQRHALLWGWTAFYFTWQSLQFNPTMRYQLPIYPALAIFAAWAVFALYDKGRQREGGKGRWLSAVAVVIGAAVLLATYAWAFAFTRIYDRPITRVEASRWIYQNIPGPVNLRIDNQQGTYNQPLPYISGYTIQPDQPFSADFAARSGGSLAEVHLPHVLDVEASPGEKTLSLTVESVTDPQVVASSRIRSEFSSSGDPRGDGYSFTIDPPLPVEQGQSYRLSISLDQGLGTLSISGAAPSNEGDWDDGLPLRLEGYDGFGGIYQPGLNFNMYTEDNPEKLERFLSILEQADYLLISSNRQWGSLPRLPERFPLVTAYYRSLLGCPEDKSIEWCYQVAQPGMFTGDLGFELHQVFQSDPSIGPVRINDQSAEEAFTVYDHPKVLIFKKSANFDINRAGEKLKSVDLSKVVHLTPKRARLQPSQFAAAPDPLGRAAIRRHLVGAVQHRWFDQPLPGAGSRRMVPGRRSTGLVELPAAEIGAARTA